MLLLKVEPINLIKGCIKMPKKKKETQKEAHRTFIETIRALHVKVRKELDKTKKQTAKVKPKPKKKIKVKTAGSAYTSLATKDKERQLRRSLGKKDIEKLRGKKKKKNNPHKKSGGY